jgi:hypothetical protein
MTIKQACTQLHGLSVDGYFNGEKFTAERLAKMAEPLFRDRPAPSQVIYQIALLDGWWWFSINKYSDLPDGYDWTIPETREEEKKLYNRLLGKDPR